MKIYLATDHTGLEQKNEVKKYLERENHEVIDCGAYEYDKDDDYPDFIGKAADGVSSDKDSIGFIFGGSGQGEQMTANKYKGVRCALFYSGAIPVSEIDISGAKSEDPFEIIKLTRQHNHANMLSFGIRFLTIEQIIKAVGVFIRTPNSDEERHARRVNKISIIEQNA